MSVSVLISFAGALAAAVGTGLLAGRFIRAPRTDLAAWSSALLMLAVALGAQTMGFAIGFSSATFRATQLAGLLLAPLWLAWGIVEVAGKTVQARFTIRLATAALTVLPGVILILDPLNADPAFGKAWPGEKHYMLLPTTALTAIHVVAVAVALLMMSITAVRTRRDPAWWDVFVPVAVAGAAVLLTVAQGFGLPNAAYPLLTAAAAVLVWLAADRSERVRLDELRAGEPPRRDSPQPRAGRRRRGRVPQDFAEPAGLTDDPTTGPLVALAADGFPAGRDLEPPIAAAASRIPSPPPVAAPPSAPQESPPGTPPAIVMSQLFGLIAIYTLLDGRGEEFDRLAERTVEAVRRHEPDTLLFVVHTVPKAPMQRIFYEVYRDRMAYSDHRRKPHVEDFFARHRPYVLATNVIELDLRYAKISALPSLSAIFSRDGGGMAEHG
jgi:quinol monooxygenase YgiN